MRSSPKVALAWSVASRFARENDPVRLKLAQKLWDAAMKMLQELAKSPSRNRVQVTGFTLTLSLPPVIPKAMSLWLEFAVAGPKVSTSYHEGPPPSVTLDCDKGVVKPRRGETPTSEDFQFLQSQLRKRKSVFIHETTHYIDHQRKAWSVGDYKTEGAEYFNQPVELNAYFQQASSEFQDYYDSLKGDDLVWDLGGFFHASADELWGEFEQRIHPKVWENLTPQNRKRFRKRAGQLFMRLKKDAARLLKPEYEKSLKEAIQDDDEWEINFTRKSLAEIRRMGIR